MVVAFLEEGHVGECGDEEVAAPMGAEEAKRARAFGRLQKNLTLKSKAAKAAEDVQESANQGAASEKSPDETEEVEASNEEPDVARTDEEDEGGSEEQEAANRTIMDQKEANVRACLL
jgi:hypothetical protein